MNGAAQPSIDIAIPFYGPLAMLQEAVLSVRAQNDPDWRLLVVDDNEPVDRETSAWLESLEDSRIHYLANDHNLGVSATFNRCVASSRADYLTIMGCDDRLLGDYVGRARASLTMAGGVGAYHPAVRVIDAAGNPVRPLTDQVKGWLRPSGAEGDLFGERLAISLMRGTWTYFPAMCWRRELLARHGFSVEQLVVQDTRLLLDLVLAGEALRLDAATTFEYRRHGAAASTKALATGTRFAEEREFYRRSADLLVAQGWARASRAARRHVTSRLNAGVVAVGLARSGDFTQAWRLTHEHLLARRSSARPAPSVPGR